MPIIKDTDPDFNLLNSVIKGMDGTTIKTGFVEGKSKNKRKKSKPDNVTIATAHEFGIGVPKRSTIRPSFDKHQHQYEHKVEKAVINSVKKKDIHTFKKETQKIGTQMKADVQNEITKLKTPPNSPETIKRKGSSNPLIDTGQMRQAVNYYITKK